MITGQTGIKHSIKTHGNYHKAKSIGVVTINSTNPVTAGATRRTPRRKDRRADSINRVGKPEESKVIVTRKF